MGHRERWVSGMGMVVGWERRPVRVVAPFALEWFSAFVVAGEALAGAYGW